MINDMVFLNIGKRTHVSVLRYFLKAVASFELRSPAAMNVSTNEPNVLGREYGSLRKIVNINPFEL
jgi:hypothetical protein